MAPLFPPNIQALSCLHSAFSAYDGAISITLYYKQLHWDGLPATGGLGVFWFLLVVAWRLTTGFTGVGEMFFSNLLFLIVSLPSAAEHGAACQDMSPAARFFSRETEVASTTPSSSSPSTPLCM